VEWVGGVGCLPERHFLHEELQCVFTFFELVILGGGVNLTEEGIVGRTGVQLRGQAVHR